MSIFKGSTEPLKWNNQVETILIIPCYNEQARLKSRLFSDFLTKHPAFGLLFVNDGSKDQTMIYLQKLARENFGRVAVFDSERNFGKAESVRRGVEAIFSTNHPIKFFGYWDADLATPLEASIDFLKVLNEDKNLVMISGARIKLFGSNISRKLTRHYLGRIFATAVGIVLNIEYYDTQCGAKLFRVCDISRYVFKQKFISKWIFDVEIILRINFSADHNDGLMMREVPLNVWIERGHSKVKSTDFFKSWFDLLKIWFWYKTRPWVRNPFLGGRCHGSK